MTGWGKCKCTSMNNCILKDEKQTNWL